MTTDGLRANYTPNAAFFGSDTFSYTVTDGNDSAVGSVAITVNQAADPADLGLTQSVDNEAPVVGSTVSITLSLQSQGPAAASGVAVTHALGAGLTISSAQPTLGRYDQGSGVWTVGDVPANATAQLYLTAVVNEAGPYTTGAAITASNRPDPNAVNDVAAVVTLVPQP